MEIQKIQEAKYLWHWRQLYIKETEQHQVALEEEKRQVAAREATATLKRTASDQRKAKRTSTASGEGEATATSHWSWWGWWRP